MSFGERMMESPGLLSMPVELIHHISSYLSADDVIRCSQTCHYLRSTLNDNAVWKRYMPQQDISALEFMEPQVEPVFRLDQTLSPLCENRMKLLRKSHLVNNWKQDNFLEHSTKTLFHYANGVFHVPRGEGQLIYKDRYIFLGRFVNDVESDAIEVWDIVESPVLHSVITVDNKDYESFYIIGNNLVVVECIKVNVYEITLPEKKFPLVFSFLITEDEVVFHQHVVHIGRHDFRCVGWAHSSAGQYLISNKCGEPECIFHVWDIFNAAKVGTFYPPIDCFSVVVHSFEKNNWVLTQHFQSGNDTFFLRFNIDTREFSDYVFKYTGYPQHIIFYGSHVILFRNADNSNAEGWYDSVCLIYNFQTSKELRRRRFNNAKKNYQLGSTVVLNGAFVLLCNDGFNVVNALNLQTVSRFPCDDAHHIVNQYDLHGSIFVVSCAHNAMEVWDVAAKKKLPKLLGKRYWDHMYINDLCTSLVCIGYMKINVMHFW